MKSTIIIFGFALIAIGCSEILQDNEYYKLPDNYKTELEESDTLIFGNEELQRDSFVVVNIVKGNMQLAISGTSSKEPYAFHEFEYIMIKNINDQFDSFKYNTMITQADGNYGEGTSSLETSCDSLIIGIRVGTQNLWDVTYEDAQKGYNPLINWYSQKYFDLIEKIDSTTIGKYDYSDILEFSYDNGVKKLLYDYKVGIVKYVDSDNKTWLRIN